MSYSNGPRIATSNLLLALDAANTKSYPGSGATWNDLSGNNRNFSLINTYSYSSNNRGILNFTRTMPPTGEWGGYAQYTGTGNLSVSYLYSNHTTEIVAKINNRNPTAHNATESNSALFVYVGYHAMFYYSASVLRYYIWNLTSNTISSPQLTIGTTSSSDIIQGQWFAVTATRSGNTLSIYLNGVFKGSNVTAGASNNNATTSQLRIAVAADTAQQYSWHADCSVGAVRMYNRVLTDVEIANNFNCTRGRYGL